MSLVSVVVSIKLIGDSFLMALKFHAQFFFRWENQSVRCRKELIIFMKNRVADN